MIWLYIIAFILSIILLAMICEGTKRYNNTFYILCAVTIVVVNFGYWQRAAAKNLWEALLANRISYLDGPFLTLFMLLTLAKFCDIRIPKWLIGIFVCLSMGVLSLVFTGGYQGAYYKEVSLIRLHGISSLEKVYGPAHVFYYALLGIYVLLMAGVLLYAVWNRERFSYINTFFFFGIVFSCVLVYVIEVIFSLDVTLLPFAYVFMEIFLYFLIRRMNMYDISANAANVRDEKGQYGYIAFSASRKYMGCNEKAGEFFEELRKQRIDYLFPSSEKFLYEEFDRWIYDFERGAVASKYLERNGRILYCTLNYFKEGNRGRRSGYLVEVFDDTQRQKHIKKMREMNEKLAKLAEEAEKANQAKSEFLANMSHEIRTPINAVLGLDEMILRETEDSEIRIYAENIRTAGDALLFTVNDLLDFSKIEQGKMEIDHSLYSLKDCILDVLQIVFQRIEEKGLSLVLGIDEKLPVRYYGDVMHLKQILMNLLTNAVKYTEKGTITLSVSICDHGKGKEDDRFAGLLFSVKDTGRGIRKADQKLLFKAFKRFDEKKNNGIEGTGLGLSITSNLLMLMGSALQVESEYGKGSDFFFELRQEHDGEERMGDFFEKDIYTLQKEANSRETFQVEKYQAGFTAPEAEVLLVDDNKMNLYVFQKLLKSTEIQPDTAVNGKEAIQRIKEKSYDIILMDHLMPEIDGVETLEKMRAEDGNPLGDAKVIMVTANAVSGSEEIYKKAGFDDFMVKPVSGKGLEKILFQYLPAEKVRKVSGQISETKKERMFAGGGLAVLSKKIQIQNGMAYANQDKEFYLELLKIFAGEYRGKRKELEKYILQIEKSSFYQSFIRLVHDLKGEARGIGAFSLGEMFFRLEKAGKSEDKDRILSGLPETLKEYEQVVQLIESVL